MLLNWPQLEDSFKSDFGSNFVLHSAEPVAGGDINLSFELDTNLGTYFIKLNTPDKLEMFQAEREGLLELAKCQSLVVPEPLSVGQNANAAFLCMTWLDLRPDIEHGPLGEAIALMHEPIGQQFGGAKNNFIGSTVQHNGWSDSWADFFWEKRLEPQIYQMLEVSSTFPESALEPLKEKVLALLGAYDFAPSLVHGDLWNGNVGTTIDGKPAIFDPAVYWGHSETDLALARLFGGFSETFFEAYESVRPALQDEEDRLLVYQLYHLLNHYNLFGSNYLDQCIRQIGKIMAL